MIIQCKLTDDLFSYIKENINNYGKSHNTELAGNIRDEFSFMNHREKISSWLLPLISKQDSLRGLYDDNRKKFDPEPDKIFIHDMWINFMKEYEFNPVHVHQGFLSFIIFVKIPYTCEEQQKISPGKNSNNAAAGKLEFITHPNITELLPVDRSWEQICLIFPSSLMHCVYPFYGVKEERITIAGNIKFML